MTSLRNINLIILFYRRLSVLYGLPFASTVIWNFLFSNWGPWRLLWCPDEVMWHLWAQCPGERSEDSPWSVWERCGEESRGCHATCAHDGSWGPDGIWIASQLRQIEALDSPMGRLPREGPWAFESDLFKVEPPTKKEHDSPVSNSE